MHSVQQLVAGPALGRRREMQGEVALAYFCVLLIAGGLSKRKENARWSAVGGVGGTLCQCVNDPGEDDWWLVVVVCRSRARHEEEACPRCVSWSHCSAFTLPRPWRRSMIMATRRRSEHRTIILVQVSASGHVTSLLVQGVVPSTQCSASMINDAMVKYKCLHLE